MQLIHQFMDPHPWQPGITFAVLSWAREKGDEWLPEAVL